MILRVSALRRSIAAAVLTIAAIARPLAAQVRVSDLTTHGGDVPVRLVGYGLVVGLDGSGDRSFGSSSGAVHTVRSVTNLLRRFNIEVPGDRLRLRNVAAVLVTAEVSPYLRPGGHFEVQVASIGDATSLRGGVLWITPLVISPDAPPVASAQGPLPLVEGDGHRWGAGGSASGRVAEGGVLEVSLPAIPPQTATILALRDPDLTTASRIASAINKARGDSTAKVEDAGAVSLKLPASATDSPLTFLAALDTLPVVVPAPARIVIDAHNGMVVAGGDMHVGTAVVSLRGITVRVGGDSTAKPVPGVVAVSTGASVRDIAVGLQALGAVPSEVAAVFDGLRAAGAIAATVVVR
ncbi:MAG TPA: flagellar basal body P-ring protein FlgI [Gemmatimonadales bacterium]